MKRSVLYGVASVLLVMLSLPLLGCKSAQDNIVRTKDGKPVLGGPPGGGNFKPMPQPKNLNIPSGIPPQNGTLGAGPSKNTQQSGN
jgi:hypothetical protein